MSSHGGASSPAASSAKGSDKSRRCRPAILATAHASDYPAAARALAGSAANTQAATFDQGLRTILSAVGSGFGSD